MDRAGCAQESDMSVAERYAHLGKERMAIVEDLFVYPLKSARGIAQPAARLGATGFEWDRQWMAVDARGTFVSQRTHPKLAQIEPAITGDSLTLTARELEPLRLPLEPTGAPV